MEEVYARFKALRSKASDHGHELAGLLGIQSTEMPAGVFPMVFNKLTLGLEMLHYYHNIWKQVVRMDAQAMEQAKRENGDKVMAIERMIFIEAVSSIEYCSKAYVAEHPAKMAGFFGRVYLRNIMARSREHGVISRVEFERWEGAIELRNCIVHNNGISEKTARYVYPSCELVLEDGRMTQGDLLLLPSLLDWMLDSYRCWIIEMDGK